MTPALVLAVATAGGAGAVIRWLLNSIIPPIGAMKVPGSTLWINVTGSLALGVVTGLAGVHLIPAEWRTILTTGLLGGYTTFSTASNDTVTLVDTGHRIVGFAYAFGMFALAVAGAGLGMGLGRAL